MASSSSRAGRPGRGVDPLEALSQLTVHLGLPAGDDALVGDHHEIVSVPRGPIRAPEALAQQALRAVAGDGAAHLAGDGETEAVATLAVGRVDDQEQSARQARAALEHRVELRGGREAKAAPEMRPHAWRALAVTLGPIRPRSACGPSGGGASAPAGRPSCASA